MCQDIVDIVIVIICSFIQCNTFFSCGPEITDFSFHLDNDLRSWLAVTIFDGCCNNNWTEYFNKLWKWTVKELVLSTLYTQRLTCLLPLFIIRSLFGSRYIWIGWCVSRDGRVSVTVLTLAGHQYCHQLLSPLVRTYNVTTPLWWLMPLAFPHIM